MGYSRREFPLTVLLHLVRPVGAKVTTGTGSGSRPGAAYGGALGTYLRRRGDLGKGDLFAGVPVATKPGKRRYSGNHLDNLVICLGTHLAEPRERIRLIHDTAAGAREVREAFDLALFEDRPELTPSILYPLGVRLWARTRLANRLRPPLSLIASNVPGPRETLELDGTVVTAIYSGARRACPIPGSSSTTSPLPSMS